MIHMIVGSTNRLSEREYTFSESQLSELYDRAFAEGYRSRDEEDREERAERRAARRDWKLQDSHRGLGRSLILGGIPGSLGAYVTKGDVDRDYREGYEDEEIIDRAAKNGARNGALLYGAPMAAGAALSGYLGAKKLNKYAKEANKINPAAAAALMAASYGSYGLARGGLGGYLGAKKNAEARLDLSRIERRSK